MTGDGVAGEIRTLAAISALASPHRLRAFRMLVRRGGAGMPAGEIAQALDVPPSTLSSHLAQLERAGLLRATRQDRRILYAADLDGAKGLLAYLLDDCCDGHPELCGYVATLGPFRHLMTRQPADRTAAGDDRPFRVLVLSRRNAARSLIAEAVLNRLGRGRFEAYSAGTEPADSAHGPVLEVLHRRGLSTDGLRPKSTARFEAPGAPRFDFLVGVADRARGRPMPRWKGRPTPSLWNLPDLPGGNGPAGAAKPAGSSDYWDLFDQIAMRARLFLDLPMEQLRRRSLITQGLDTTSTPESRSTVMDRDAFNVLFLCRGNSARSIMAEAILNREGKGRFRAVSAGSDAVGTVHPYTLDLLRQLDHPTDGLRSKSWDAFAGETADRLDFVFTVCDQAAAEVCPVWPGQPMTAHWGVPDPAAAAGTEAERRLAFSDAYRMLMNRIGLFVNLPIASLDRLSLQKQLDEIGRSSQAAPV